MNEVARCYEEGYGGRKDKVSEQLTYSHPQHAIFTTVTWFQDAEIASLGSLTADHEWLLRTVQCESDLLHHHCPPVVHIPS